MGVCYDANSDICKSCKSADNCGDQAYEALSNASGLVDMTAFIKQRHGRAPESSSDVKVEASPVKHPIDEKTSKLIGGLTKKAAALAKSIATKGVNVRSSLNRGYNPFEAMKPLFMRTPCRLLLQGGFTKAMLKVELLRDNPEWKERTAEGQVSVICAYLEGMNIAKINEGKYILRVTND